METEPTAAEIWRERLRLVVGDHGGPAAVARLADIRPQSLKNYLSGRTKKPPIADLARIAAACGVEAAWLAALKDDGLAMPRPLRTAAPEKTAGMEEGDVAPFLGKPRDIAGRLPVNHGRWTVRSRALELAGYLPGDLVEFDMGRSPRTGEPVVAQVYDDQGGAETVLRLYRPPFLMVHTADPAIDPRPIPLDAGEMEVKIMGGLVRMIREPAGD